MCVCPSGEVNMRACAQDINMILIFTKYKVLSSFCVTCREGSR